MLLAGGGKELDIRLALMIALVMIMLHIFMERMLEGRFPKQDQPRQTFLFHRAHPALRISVQIRRSRWPWYPVHAACVDELLKGRAVFAVPVMDEVLPR